MAEPTPLASETAEPLAQTAETVPTEETVEKRVNASAGRPARLPPSMQSCQEPRTE